jgi:hypothetical protein
MLTRSDLGKVGLTSSDGYANLLSGLGSDPHEASIYLTTLGPRLPWFVRAISGALLSRIDPKASSVVVESRTKSVSEYHKWCYRRYVLYMHSFPDD